MIRLLLKRLTTDVDALRAENNDIRERFETSQRAVVYNDGRCDELYAENYALRAENTRLRALAGNTEATPAEREVLAVVATMPGALAKGIGRAVVVANQAKARKEWDDENPGKEPTGWMWFIGEPGDSYIADEVKHLSSLHKKGLVRRERAGQSYRYWTVSDAL